MPNAAFYLLSIGFAPMQVFLRPDRREGDSCGKRFSTIHPVVATVGSPASASRGPNGRERVGGLLVLPRVQEDGWLSGGSLVRPSPQNLMMMSEAMVNWEALLPPAKGVVPLSDVSKRISGRKMMALTTGLSGMRGVMLRPSVNSA